MVHKAAIPSLPSFLTTTTVSSPTHQHLPPAASMVALHARCLLSQASQPCRSILSHRHLPLTVSETRCARRQL
ncbi:hypothetical protein BD309DRAFT_956617 [Dichomitus squalens]|nr:hypothetical protein BD309DRAFT_956617 [Dichomitus squalens]